MLFNYYGVRKIKMINKNFTDKYSHYYTHEKSVLLSYIADGANKILDIGCGSGSLGKKLIELGKVDVIIGVEVYDPAADEAANYYNQVYRGDIEELDVPFKEDFHYIICADVIEHLKEPWKLLQRINIWLKQDGKLIITIPNIRYWRILSELIFKGQWAYVDSGILDITHLRFFTRQSLKNLLNNNQFTIEYSKMLIHGQKKNFLNILTFSIFQEFLGSQILVIAQKQ